MPASPSHGLDIPLMGSWLLGDLNPAPISIKLMLKVATEEGRANQTMLEESATWYEISRGGTNLRNSKGSY